MASNSFGNTLRLTTFGESHGPAIGGVIDGFPAGFEIPFDYIRHQMQRRRPGQSALTTARSEADEIEWLSGIFEGKTTGAPIAFIIRNTDSKSADYEHLKDVYRPSHADYVYEQKYGIRDHRGGGRSSARVMAPIVAAGAMARYFLQQKGIDISAYVSRVGNIEMSGDYRFFTENAVDATAVRCPDRQTAAEMEQLILTLKASSDSVGGMVSCVIQGCPAGLGDPFFEKLNANLAKAMFSINAVKAVEFGSGIKAATMKGSEHNDAFELNDNKMKTVTNYSGGIQGGISNGMDITFRVAFKPPATIAQMQHTVNNEGEAVTLAAKGRHDPCVAPRAVPIVEAMAAWLVMEAYSQR